MYLKGPTVAALYGSLKCVNTGGGASGPKTSPDMVSAEDIFLTSTVKAKRFNRSATVFTSL